LTPPGNQAYSPGGRAVFTVTVTGTSPVLGGTGSIVSDAQGNLYAAGSTSIFKIAPGGAVSTYASNIGTYSVSGLAVDFGGNVYATTSDTVFKVSPSGVATRVLQEPGYDFSGIAVDSGGNIYVSDSYANAIRKITPGGAASVLAGGSETAGSADGTGSA